MKTSLFVASVFVITFAVLAGLGLVLGLATAPHGEVTITQLPNDGEQPVQVAQVEYRPHRPF